MPTSLAEGDCWTAEELGLSNPILLAQAFQGPGNSSCKTIFGMGLPQADTTCSVLPDRNDNTGDTTPWSNVSTRFVALGQSTVAVYTGLDAPTNVA